MCKWYHLTQWSPQEQKNAYPRQQSATVTGLHEYHFIVSMDLFTNSANRNKGLAVLEICVQGSHMDFLSHTMQDLDYMSTIPKHLLEKLTIITSRLALVSRSRARVYLVS